MESLIFFLVVMIIIVTNILKVQKKLKESKPAKEGQKKGWKENLKDLLAEMQKEMEQASKGESSEQRPQRSRPSGWDQVLPPEPEQPEAPARRVEPKTESRPVEARREPRMARQRETLIESRRQWGQTPEARMEEAEKRSETPVRKGARLGKKEAPLYGADTYMYPETYTYPETFGAEKTSGRKRRFGKRQLQRAVIWYEVLGPPMSLRDPEREMWL